MIDHHLTGRLSRARGVIGRYPEPSHRYIFEWDAVDDRPIHMIGVPKRLIVEWWADDAFVAREHLDGWVGHATHRADTVIEFSPETPF